MDLEFCPLIPRKDQWLSDSTHESSLTCHSAASIATWAIATRKVGWHIGWQAGLHAGVFKGSRLIPTNKGRPNGKEHGKLGGNWAYAGLYELFWGF